MPGIDQLRDNPYLFLKIPEDKPVPNPTLLTLDLTEAAEQIRQKIKACDETTPHGCAQGDYLADLAQTCDRIGKHLPDLMGRVKNLMLRIEQTTQPGQLVSFNELDELRKSLNRVEDTPEPCNAFTKIGWVK